MRVLFVLSLLLASSATADFRERYKEGKFAEALTELESTPEAAAKNYAYFLNRGLIHHALNQDALAVAYLSKAEVLNPKGTEVDEPLADATGGLVKWLGVSRLDPTSFVFETAGEKIPLDWLFYGFAILSLAGWLAFFLFPAKRPFFTRWGIATLGLALLFGGWSTWVERHPLVIVMESRMVKSGPGETYLDRGPVEPGMKLRVVGQMSETTASGTSSSPARWWKVRFNERHDLGFLPERSGLLLTDESNTPGA